MPLSRIPNKIILSLFDVRLTVIQPFIKEIVRAEAKVAYKISKMLQYHRYCRSSLGYKSLTTETLANT